MSYDDDPKLAEITRLNHQLTDMWALADDLADALANHTDHGFPPKPEIVRVLARYREARQP